jgi:Flp pilus assembly protein TadB
LQVTLSASAFVATLALGGKIISLFLAAFLGFILLPLLSTVMFQAKLRSFVQEFPHLLQLTNGLMRAGFEPMSALEKTAQGLEPRSVLYQEFDALFINIKNGVPLEKALLLFGRTLPLPEIELFIQSLLLSREGPAQLQKVFNRIGKLVLYRYR